MTDENYFELGIQHGGVPITLPLRCRGAHATPLGLTTTRTARPSA